MSNFYFLSLASFKVLSLLKFSCSIEKFGYFCVFFSLFYLAFVFNFQTNCIVDFTSTDVHVHTCRHRKKEGRKATIFIMTLLYPPLSSLYDGFASWRRTQTLNNTRWQKWYKVVTLPLLHLTPLYIYPTSVGGDTL